VLLAIELVADAENSLAALIRNLQEVFGDFEKTRLALRRSRGRGKTPRGRE
jgi:hypothetical protein